MSTLTCRLTINIGSQEEVDGRPPMRLQVACMSRAGKEPGFKKTNQDNCFAFEKYITTDQSLFGAMDGHGPHGRRFDSMQRRIGLV